VLIDLHKRFSSQEQEAAPGMQPFWKPGKRKTQMISHLGFEFLARPEGFEPPTPWFVASRGYLGIK